MPANARLLIAPKATVNGEKAQELDVVIFGHSGAYTGAVMLGTTPAIEGIQGATPYAALNKLLLTTCEMLNSYIPKLGAHQRNVHAGGIFDEDLISVELMEAQKRAG
jgi:hypothetical protein